MCQAGRALCQCPASHSGHPAVFKRYSSWCAGTMGLKGDLTAGEIVEQLVHAQRVTTIKNVVFMVSNRDFPSSAFTSLISLPQTLHSHMLRCKGQKGRPWLRCIVQPQALASLCSLSNVTRASTHFPLLQGMCISPEPCAVCRAWESRLITMSRCARRHARWSTRRCLGSGAPK